MKPGEERERLGARQLGPQKRLSRDVGNAPVRGHRIGPGVHAEQLRPAARRAMELRAAAGSSSSSRRRSGRDSRTPPPARSRSVEILERHDVAVPLRQPLGHDRAHTASGHTERVSAPPGGSGEGTKGMGKRTSHVPCPSRGRGDAVRRAGLAVCGCAGGVLPRRPGCRRDRSPTIARVPISRPPTSGALRGRHDPNERTDPTSRPGTCRR